MFDVFLSHNSADKPVVEELARRLVKEGLQPWLDRWNLIPGEPWQEAIENALQSCATCAVFFGPSGTGPWHNAEMRAALDRAVRTRDEYRVIPVLLPGASEESVSTFLAQRVWVDFRSGLDDIEAFNRLVAGIKGEAIEGGSYTLPDEPAPYRGLLRFEAEHARFFFGREEDTRRLVEKLSQQTFVAVVGASGSGKSSLVRAGLLPALAQDAILGSKDWRILVFTPGSDPLRALAEQLATLVPLADCLQIADDLAERLAQRADGLRTAVSTLTASQPQPLLLIVDQFEEIFTLCQEPDDRCRERAAQFAANLSDAVTRGNGSIRVVITLRADFLDRCLAYGELRELLQDRQVLLGALTESALRDAIVRPAQVVGAFFEKGLVNLILRDVEIEPGVLPLLQHALHELWRARRGPWLTLEAYEKSGGVRGALRRRAENTYGALTPTQQTIARNLFLRLTALGEGSNDTRRRASLREVNFAGVDPDQVDSVIQALSGTEARLILVDEKTLEVAHEALIRSWPRLREWLEEDRAGLRVQQHLSEDAQMWIERRQDRSYLYDGVKLAQAEDWARKHPKELTSDEERFLRSSKLARTTRRLVRSVSIVSVPLLMVVFATLVTLGLSGQLNRWIYRPLPMTWIHIPAGEFLMGSSDSDLEAVRKVCPSCSVKHEQPQHMVQLDSFAILQFEVTNEQYRRCVRAGVCNRPANQLFELQQLDQYPVADIDWEDASVFCKWAGGRLPSEAEWEKAARGPSTLPETSRTYPWGPYPDAGKANVAISNKGQAMPVGSYSPAGDSIYGVADMAGNVWEWTADWYDAQYYKRSPSYAPKGSDEGSHRVIRGGSHEDDWVEARSSYRAYYLPNNVSRDLGFRCVRGISQ